MGAFCKAKMGSAFDGTGADSFNDVLLHDQVEKDDGRSGQHQGGHGQGVILPELANEFVLGQLQGLSGDD